MNSVEDNLALVVATGAVPEDFADERSVLLFMARQVYAYIMNQELQ